MIPEKALEAAVHALREEGSETPRIDAMAALEAAAPFIAARALRDASEFARNENDRVGICGPVFNGGFGYALRIVGELADELDPPDTPTNS